MAHSRIVVLASGSGSVLQAVLDSPVRENIVAVGSDIPEAQALARADRVGIATFDCPLGEDRGRWDTDLARTLVGYAPDWIVCAGFMRILGPAVLAAFPDRIINTHPALLPAFPGAHAVRDALTYGARVTGCTVHLVDAGVDTGPIIAQQAVTIRDGDDEASLHERIKEIERVLLVDVVERIIHDGIVVQGRSVRFG